jgi:hypothetical protein
MNFDSVLEKYKKQPLHLDSTFSSASKKVEYSDAFRRTTAITYDLKSPWILADYKRRGYYWIRRDTDRTFRQIVRNPTIGCHVELFVRPYPGTVHIDSAEARRLINRLNYF